MDPDTTLFTFMLQTTSKTQTVELVGSWDNFSKRYPMQKDDRRGRGQWRGCYTFKDIICDGDGERSPKRNGGLKMGHTYWYYYELDDGSEIHDTSLPSTTACPFLPGQPVNLIYVPVEINPLRERSASMNSIASENLMTMNPDDKFLTPRAAPPTPTRLLPRLNTSPAVLEVQRAASSSARSASPGRPRSPWSARALFGLRSPTSAASPLGAGERGRLTSPVSSEFDGDANISSPTLVYSSVSDRPLFPIGPRSLSSREASPISLRNGLFSAGREASSSSASAQGSREQSPIRHLHHHHPVMPENSMNMNAMILEIPDQIIEEEGEYEEDDTNFASLLAPVPDLDLEKSPITTLSPPPSRQRSASPPQTLAKLLTDGAKPLPTVPDEMEHSPASFDFSPSLVPSPLHLHPFSHNTTNTSTFSSPSTPHSSTRSPRLNGLNHNTNTNNLPRSHFSIDTISSSLLSASSPLSVSDNENDSSSHSEGSSSPPSIYDSYHLDSDDASFLQHHDPHQQHKLDFNLDSFDFGFDDPRDSHEAEDADAEIVHHPHTSAIPYRPFQGFQGYSLPMGEYGSESTLLLHQHHHHIHQHKNSTSLSLAIPETDGIGLALSPDTPDAFLPPLVGLGLGLDVEAHPTGPRSTFGPVAGKTLPLRKLDQTQIQATSPREERQQPAAVRELDLLLKEMGWMGEVIVGK